MEIFFLIAFGIFIGTVGSMLGIGGGFFIVALLVLSFKIPIHSAVAISLITIVATSGSAMALKIKRGLVNIRLGTILDISTVSGALIGSIVATSLSDRTLKIIFSSVLVVVSYMMFKKGYVNLKHHFSQNGKTKIRTAKTMGEFYGEFYDDNLKQTVSYNPKKIPFVFFMSTLAGCISGMLGTGGGIVKVPILNIVSKMPIKASTATSNFMIGVTTSISAIVYFKYGIQYPNIIASLIVGILVGTQIGTRILFKIKAELLHIFFSLILIFAAVKMFLSL
jgi:uncharacterized protein